MCPPILVRFSRWSAWHSWLSQKCSFWTPMWLKFWNYLPWKAKKIRMCKSLQMGVRKLWNDEGIPNLVSDFKSANIWPFSWQKMSKIGKIPDFASFYIFTNYTTLISEKNAPEEADTRREIKKSWKVTSPSALSKTISWWGKKAKRNFQGNSYFIVRCTKNTWKSPEKLRKVESLKKWKILIPTSINATFPRMWNACLPAHQTALKDSE